MKKLLYIFLFIFICLFSSCNKKEVNYNELPTISLTVLPTVTPTPILTNTQSPTPTNTPTPTPIDEKMARTLDCLVDIDDIESNIFIDYLSFYNIDLLKLEHNSTYYFIPTENFQLKEKKKILISNLKIDLLLTEFFDTYFENFENYKHGIIGTISSIYIDNEKYVNFEDIIISKNNNINMMTNDLLNRYNNLELIVSVPINTNSVKIEYICDLYTYDENLSEIKKEIIVTFEIYNSDKECLSYLLDENTLSGLLFNDYINEDMTFKDILSYHQDGFCISDDVTVKITKQAIEDDELLNFTSHAFFNMKYFWITFPYYNDDHTNMTEMSCSNFNIYDYSLYDFSEIFSLKQDDWLVTSQGNIRIKSIIRNGNLIFFNNEYFFKTDGDGYYYQIDKNGQKFLKFLEYKQYLISKDCVIIDNGDTILPGTLLAEDFELNFDKYKSKIVVENGIIVKIIRENLSPIENLEENIAE